MDYDILLMNIARDMSGYSSCFYDSIGQYLIASYLRERDFTAQVYAGCVADCKEIIEKEIGGKKTRILGFYAAADNVRIVSHVIKWVKARFSVITVVGGPQAIALGAEFFQETSNDFTIVGEGEIPMFHLLSYLIDGSGTIEDVPSVKYWDRNKGCVVWNQCDDAIVTDLDTIPFPHQEDSLTGRLRQGKMVGIITGRGCPNHCAFCYEGANAKHVRFRSIANVMEEVDYIVQQNPTMEYINIYDDTFTLKPERVLAFCREMKARKLKWFCEGHVSFVLQYPEILKEMVDSGLTCIQFGIESGADRVLEAYGKRISRGMIEECIQICKDSGIHGITGNFIIGGAGEDGESLAESRELAAKLLEKAKGILELYTVYFAPYPNTKMTANPQDYGIRIQEELLQYNLNTMRSPVVETKALSVQQIYREKQEFDHYLAECYRKAALASTKSDLVQGLFQDGKRVYLNPTWEKAYASFNHIEVFLQHLTIEEQSFAPDAYPIRTVEDFFLEGECMVTEIGTFSGMEKELLLNASGVYTAGELADQLGLTTEQMKALFQRLNERCLVYMSLW